jgi:hypothetical protein
MEKSLKKPINKLHPAILIILGLFLVFSCKREQPSPNSGTFFKTYQSDSSTTGEYLEQMPDGSYMIESFYGPGRPLLTRLDKYGRLIWNKKIQLKGNDYASDIFPLNDGSSFVLHPGSGPTIFKFDTTGKINIPVNLPYPSNIAYGKMTYVGSNFLLASCGFYFSSNPDPVNRIYVLDVNLNLLRIDSFNNSIIGGNLFVLNVNNRSSTGDYFLSGFKIPGKGASTSKYKMFVARISATGLVKQTIIDASDRTHEDQLVAQTNTNDSGQILLGYRYSATISYPVVVKIDKNLDTVWEKAFQQNTSAIQPNSISFCKDGGLLILGTFQRSGLTNVQPYILKIDKDGNKQWDKTISAPGDGAFGFTYGLNLDDGGYGLVGNSNQFGNGKNGNRILFVKTDANGNY